jgi:hypothetical protein
MFRANHNRGFQMEFKNGITISVQFGLSNYCERRNMTVLIQSEIKMDRVESKDAEIAIWDKEGTWFNFGHDQVKGWVEADEVATWIIFCTAATSLDDLRTRVIACEMIEEVK